MLNKEELIFVKSKLDFWDKLSTEEKDTLEKNISRVSYEKGAHLHSSEDECLGVLLIQKGELRVYILSEDGREITLFRIASGETCILSASCVLNSITFDVHIDAISHTEAFLIDISTFSRLTAENVYVENFSYKNTVERFSDVMWVIEQILFMSFDKRLAIFLLDEMANTGSDKLHLTQEQIAKYIGSAREVVSRMLKVFQEDGILIQSRGQIQIINHKKLRQVLRA